MGLVCGLNHWRSPRYVATGQCVECVADYERHPDSSIKRRAADGFTSKVHERALLAAQNGGCAYCGTERSLALDHKISIAQGGNHWPKNRQWLCGSCNSSKHTIPDAAYRRRAGLPARTNWDAPYHAVCAIDADARAGASSPMRRRARQLLDPQQALAAALTYAARRPKVGRRTHRRREAPVLPRAAFFWALVA